MADLATPRDDEADARRVLTPFVDARIVLWDDQSAPRMWDFCLVDGAGSHVGTLEVTRYTDPEFRAFHNDLYDQGSKWEAPDYVKARWIVQLEPRFGFKRNFDRDRLFRLLGEAENRGLQRITRAQPGRLHEEVANLGLHFAVATEEPGGYIWVLSAGKGWWGDGHVSRGVAQEAEANADKLLASPAPRHLFVWIDFAAVAAVDEITGTGPLKETPEMPDHVDVVWAACGEANLDGSALWRAERGMPWTVVRSFSDL